MEKSAQNLIIPAVRRMELWLASMQTDPGRVQNGICPVVIVSNNSVNAYGSVVTVVPCTSKHWRMVKPTDVCLHSCGFPAGIIAQCGQVTSLDKSCLLWQIGMVQNWYDRLAIQRALAAQLGIDLCVDLAA